MKLFDSLLYLKATKKAIKDAIELAGVAVGDIPFREYANKIALIEGESYPVEVTNSFFVDLNDNIHYFDADILPISNMGNYIFQVGGGKHISNQMIKRAVFGSEYESFNGDLYGFVNNWYSIKSADLRGLKNITKLYYAFQYSSDLEEIIFPESFPYLTSIEQSFMSIGAKSLDLKPFYNVNNVLSQSFYHLNNLKSLDLTPLSNVTNIGYGCFSNMYLLKSLDLTPLSNVKFIDYSCFNGLPIIPIDLTPLNQVESIGYDFMTGCNNLSRIRFDSLGNLLNIDSNSFNYVPNDNNRTIYCPNIEEAEAFRDHFPNLSNWTITDVEPVWEDSYIELLDGTKYFIESINDANTQSNNWASSWSFNINIDDDINISTLDVKYIKFGSIFEHNNVIGSYFLMKFFNLKDADFSGLKNINRIESNVLSVSKIKNIDLSLLTLTDGVITVFINNSEARTIKLPTITGSIGYKFLYENKRLKEIDLTPIKDAIIDDNTHSFMSYCESLKTIKFDEIGNLLNFPTDYAFYGVSEVGTIYCPNIDDAVAFRDNYPALSGWNVTDVDNIIPPYYEMAEDSDFYDGGMNLLYTGTKEYVIIPDTIISNNDQNLRFSDDYPVKGVATLPTNNITNMSHMFAYCRNLTELELKYFDTSNVTNMESMFAGCSNLTELDLSSWDVSNVTTMYYMFNDCINLTELDLSSWDTSNVITVQDMFKHCISLTELDLKYFDTSNVYNMQSMFAHCRNISKFDLSSFDMSNVTHKDSMFYDCQSATTGYARTQADADKLNATKSKPSGLNFIVKP